MRNLVRTPRRTLLTALGIGAAISTLVAVFGMLDSFTTALDRYDRDISRAAPDRVIVQFAEVLPENADVVAAVTGAGEVARSATSLLVDATARTASGQVPLALSIRDVDGGLWQPSVRGGSATGLLLSETAAEDLGVVPGDRVTLQHPRWTAAGVTSDETSVVVAGTHPDPIRAVSYLDRRSAEALGLVGLVNVAEVTPAAGVSVDELIRTLFAVPGVASAQPVTAMSDSFRNLVDEFAGILDIAAVITLLLALLIAFNATSIATDERAREHATMFAFGLPRRSVVGMGVVESAAVGLMGTVLGVGLGYLLARWTVEVQFRETMPDIGVTVALSPSTVGVALALGVGAVALTPLLTVRRLGRMDIPATLRVVE